MQTLSYLDQPHQLDFRRCPHLRDIRALLRWAGSLTRLGFAECPDVDLSSLSSLTGLRVLDLSGTPIPDLRPVAGLGELRELHLSSTRDIDLSPLADRPDLKVQVTIHPTLFD
ncbi:leucine-rich repeat domain-containing protein [Amycolatopsis vastitatis]|uniref:leucine-rich repeat domain-containing protein n=1 Tax=Amycolatopsis vastitatis TaxID=1905142 RepID=UPI001304109E|nr:leucine-rich repeat domain-containing protein [Amycolatopsis vastitatis]